MPVAPESLRDNEQRYAGVRGADFAAPQFNGNLMPVSTRLKPAEASPVSLPPQQMPSVHPPTAPVVPPPALSVPVSAPLPPPVSAVPVASSVPVSSVPVSNVPVSSVPVSSSPLEASYGAPPEGGATAAPPLAPSLPLSAAPPVTPDPNFTAV